MDKTKAPRCAQLETEFQGLAGKAFPYKIPKILKEAHNLIFSFFSKLNEKEKSITLEILEKERQRNLVK